MQFNFGQPSDGVIQMAYVVEDLPAAIRAYTQTVKAGPWFILERLRGFEPVYRGKTCQAEVALAMAFSGHILFELIQPLDDHPSVFREVVDSRGYGFHHFGQGTMEFEHDVAKYKSRGYEVVFECRPARDAGRVAYLDTHGEMPGFIELIESDVNMERMFTRFYRAAVDWDGENPMRPFV